MTSYFNHHATRVAIEILVYLDKGNQWLGTGFIVEVSRKLEEGPQIDCRLLISNKHVLAQGAGNPRIMLNKKGEDGKVLYGEQGGLMLDRSIYRYTGHKDHDIDLACLDLRGIETSQYDIPALSEKFLEELDENKIGVGSNVLYAGFPNGMKDEKNGLALMRKGSIASIPSMDCQDRGLIAIDGTIQSGNSGGPVFVEYENEYRLLGVIHARSNIAADYGFAIKQKYVKASSLIAELVKSKQLSAGDIAILTGRARKKCSLFASATIGGCPIVTADDDAGSEFIVCDTVRRFKGLEAKCVFLIDIDSLTEDELIYVALSRGALLLFVIGEETQLNRLKGDNSTSY